MTLDEYINKEFQSNLELAREEMEATCPDDGTWSERSAWNMAAEWTQEEVAMYVGKYLDNKWAGQQEATNKAHYG